MFNNLGNCKLKQKNSAKETSDLRTQILNNIKTLGIKFLEYNEYYYKYILLWCCMGWGVYLCVCDHYV